MESESTPRMVCTRQESSTVLHTSPCSQLLEEQQRELIQVLSKRVSSEAGPQ